MTTADWSLALRAGADAAERHSHEFTAMGRMERSSGDVLGAALRAMADELARQRTNIAISQIHPPAPPWTTREDLQDPL